MTDQQTHARTAPASARTVRLWLHDRVCVGYTVANPYQPPQQPKGPP